MHFRFLLSDQHGDIEFSPADLEQPFLVSPTEEHPFLTLADYFGVLQEFIMPDNGQLLRAVLGEQALPSDISEIILRSEKHGALYHIASVEIPGHEKNIKLAVTTALSSTAENPLHEEFSILQQLAGISADFIPAVLHKRSITWKTDSGTEEFIMVLGEWLDGYHEWHVSRDPDTGGQKIHLWDYDSGYRFLTDEEVYELLRQAGFILTIYYDQESFCQIYPWHHGAGDFVVQTGPDALSVKLVTARGYEPLVHFDPPQESDRLVAAIHFLLNLALRMRLDRIDGVIEPVWLGPFAVQAAVAGFFDGLAAIQAGERYRLGPAPEFLEIIRSFDERELFDMHDSLLELYAGEDRDDFLLIKEHLASHAAELHAILQSFTLD